MTSETFLWLMFTIFCLFIVVDGFRRIRRRN